MARGLYLDRAYCNLCRSPVKAELKLFYGRSRIDCPACRKPTVLSQTHPVKLFYPQNGESCGQKIRRQNDENESLSCQLADCRKTRVQRKIAYDAARSHTDKMR